MRTRRVKQLHYQTPKRRPDSKKERCNVSDLAALSNITTEFWRRNATYDQQMILNLGRSIRCEVFLQRALFFQEVFQQDRTPLAPVELLNGYFLLLIALPLPIGQHIFRAIPYHP